MISASEKLVALRAELYACNLDGLYVTRADRFQGEEVRAGDEFLAYLTGFTGSAGLGLILSDTAALFTDSRYRLQIAQQTDSDLYHSFDSADKSLSDWMAEYPANRPVRIGYDSWAVSVTAMGKLPPKLGKMDVEWVALDENPITQIWADRPAYPETEIIRLSPQVTGLSLEEKQAYLAEDMRVNNAELCLVSAPDCVNWLANIRGNDLAFTPFHLCFCLVDQKTEMVFIGGARKLAEAGFTVVGWEGLDTLLASHAQKTILCDPASLPAALARQLEDAGLVIQYRADPLLAIKARKTPTEQQGFRQAHLIDGQAFCQFWHWLEHDARTQQLTESAIAEKLTAFRAQQKEYICDSFATIAGFKGNGAIVHYRAVAGQDKKLEGAGLLLVDSGAHYQMGTTDITRSLYLAGDGQQADKQIIRHASLVLAAHIDLARARFPKGATGAQLDGICRAPLWAEGLEFGHGTGHGVGHILSVHEGPVSISKRCHLPVEAGMVLSNEPGFYLENYYGIRHENLVMAYEVQDGFLAFETLTCCPFDQQLIDPQWLTDSQIEWLNSYHGWVYKTLAPHLDAELQDWLAEKCRPLG